MKKVEHLINYLLKADYEMRELLSLTLRDIKGLFKNKNKGQCMIAI